MISFSRLLTKGLIAIALLTVGWLGGSIFPAPENWGALVKGRAAPILSQLDLSPDGLARLRASLSPGEFTRLTQNAAALAASTGDAIRIERASAEQLEAYAESAPSAPPPRPPRSCRFSSRARIS